MHIRILEARAHNFKAHRDLTVSFGERTEITGDNAKGKSSVLEILTWALYGNDTFGGKLDPTPTNYKFDAVKAEALIDVDGHEIKFGRGIEKGKIVYYVNDVPSKASDFDEIVRSLFDKELFLSLFNPSYFFTLHWTKQRELLMRFVSPPAAKEVYAEMSRQNVAQKAKDIELNPQANALLELTKKHDRSQIAEIHRKNKNDKDAAYLRAQGKVQALEEQLRKLPEVPDDIEGVEVVDSALMDQIRLLEEKIGVADEPLRKLQVLQSTLSTAKQNVEAAKARYMRVHGEEIKEDCPTCSRPLDAESIESVKADKEARKIPLREEHDKAVAERKRIEAEIAKIELIDKSELIAEQRALEEKRDRTADLIAAHKARINLQADLDKARAEEAETLKSRNDSTFVLDALKAYEAKAAELQAAKVQDMFTTLTISLFKEVKSTGEQQPNFEIERDGKGYAKLSRSERAHAGIELAGVLSSMSETVAPLAVDDSESVFRIGKPAGQLILLRAVENKELTIETEEK